ncbi:hypothetical protein MMC16_007085 [Acarospora aff. strigata]|nr:hypothetical protein [Acarospora aff. strigata]
MILRHPSILLTLIPLLLLPLSTISLAASTSFCKCTCFSNSTIIPLNAASPSRTAVAHNTLHLLQHRADSDSDGDNKVKSSTQRAGNCNDCNRQFCLNYNLPICKGAGEEDVFTTCFREFFSFFMYVSSQGGQKGGLGREGRKG